MHTLFQDEFYPATEALGFVRAPAEDVAHAYADWSSRLGFATRTTKHVTDLRRTMPLLEPLTHDPSRVIVAATQNRDRSAVFTNSAPGNDPTSAIAVLSRDLRTDGVKVVYTPDVREMSGVTLGRLGARIFFYTAYDAANERSIAVPSRTPYSLDNRDRDGCSRRRASRWPSKTSRHTDDTVRPSVSPRRCSSSTVVHSARHPSRKISTRGRVSSSRNPPQPPLQPRQ